MTPQPRGPLARSSPAALALVPLLWACAVVPGIRPATSPDGPFPRPPTPEAPFPAPSPDRPWVAIVIDDLGESQAELAPFLAVPLPLSFAVLSDAVQARQVARSLVDLGRDVLAHVPMEPAEGDHPLRPGYLSTAMDAATIRAATRLALARVPGVIGVNNHMGSRFTRSPEAVRPFAEVLADRGLFFLDSRTDPATVAEEVAAAAGVRAVRRAVFLDNVDDPLAIAGMLDALVAAARTRGCAIAIGHPRPGTAEALGRFAADPARTVDVVPISLLVGRACATGKTEPAPSPGTDGR